MRTCKQALIPGAAVGCLSLVLCACGKDLARGHDAAVDSTSRGNVTSLKVILSGLNGPGEGTDVTFELPAHAVNIPWQMRFNEARHLPHNPYAVMGRMQLKYEDGTDEWITLFVPLGRIERGEAYEMVDLHEIKEYLLKTRQFVDTLLAEK